MGKVPASLLSVIVHLYLIKIALADEQVRKAQEELRNRHLFYGPIDGEVTPALTVAIGAYQDKKGFVRSGRLDLETSASLGLMVTPAKSVRLKTPSVLVAGGELRGANGEALPNLAVTNRASNEPYVELATSVVQTEQVALATAGDDIVPLIKERRSPNPRPHVRSRRIQPRKGTNPFMSVVHTVDHAFRLLVGDTQPKKKTLAAKRL